MSVVLSCGLNEWPGAGSWAESSTRTSGSGPVPPPLAPCCQVHGASRYKIGSPCCCQLAPVCLDWAQVTCGCQSSMKSGPLGSPWVQKHGSRGSAIVATGLLNCQIFNSIRVRSGWRMPRWAGESWHSTEVIKQIYVTKLRTLFLSLTSQHASISCGNSFEKV